MSYLDDVAKAAALPVYPAVAVYTSKGAVIGIRNGYLSAFGTGKVGNAKAVALLLRFQRGAATEIIRQSVVSSPAVLEALGEKKWPSKFDKTLTVGADVLVFNWTYSLRHPSADKLLLLQSALAEALRPVAPPHDTACDICHGSKQPEVMLYEGVPGYYCLSCRMLTVDKQNQAAADYEALETNLAGGILYGAVGCVAGALAWGLVAYGIHRIFLWGAILIGYMVAWCVFKGVGKINRVGQALVFVYTIASILLGDILFMTLSLAKAENVPISLAPFTRVAGSIVSLELATESGIASLIFGLIGAVFAVYQKGRKPKFAARFEPLPPA